MSREGKEPGETGESRNVIKRKGKVKTNGPVIRVDLCRRTKARTVVSQGRRDKIDRRLWKRGTS